jgi:hypothetical protein
MRRSWPKRGRTHAQTQPKNRARSGGSSDLRPIEKMALSREELIQLQYMELQSIAHELFDASAAQKPFGRNEYTHFGPLLAGCWDPSDQSWDEWLDSCSNCSYARQSLDVLLREARRIRE